MQQAEKISNLSDISRWKAVINVAAALPVCPDFADGKHAALI